MSEEPIPSRFQVWKLAARPHTLTASVVPVIVGYASTLQLIRRHGGDGDDALLRHHQELDGDSCPASGADEGGGGACDASSSGPSALALAVQFAAFAAMIQISTNLHNDYADFVKGADTEKRVGQVRATQKGWLTPYETCRGCVLCLLAALILGMRCLIPTSEKCAAGGVDDGSGHDRYDPVMAFVVMSSLFNAVAYTGGPFPLGYVGLGGVSIGYSGLGDLFVFAYFGVVATVGAPYLYLTKVACYSPASVTMAQLGELMQPSLLRSVPIGFLATAIIVVNNLRDRHTDVHAGKRTVAVRFGETFARTEYLLLVLGSYACSIYFWLSERRLGDGDSGDFSAPGAWAELLPLFSLPAAVPQLRAVAFGGKDGPALNDHVGGTAKLQMIYCVLMTAGLIASQ